MSKITLRELRTLVVETLSDEYVLPSLSKSGRVSGVSAEPYSGATLDRFSQRILRVMNRFARPVMVGELCDSVNCSIERIEEVLEGLEEKGEVRRLSRVEVIRNGLDPRAPVYKLTFPTSLEIGHRDDQFEVKLTPMMLRKIVNEELEKLNFEE